MLLTGDARCWYPPDKQEAATLLALEQAELMCRWRRRTWLIFMPKAILEYAVVHELCHLEHRHHSAAFWSLVKTVLPDYERRKAWLEQHGAGYDL